MLEQEIKAFARSVLDTHGLQAWSFVIDTATSHRLGQCRYSRKQISLSAYIFKSDAPAEVLLAFCKDTVLHETAHAIVGGGHGHDYVWRGLALELGCRNPASTVNTRADWGFDLYRAPKNDKFFTIVMKTATGGLESFGQRNNANRISELYIKYRKRETYGHLMVVPTSAFKDYTLGLATADETLGETATVEKKAAFSAAPPQVKAKTKSTYTAFTKSIYTVGMSFMAFTASYLEGKPTAASNTIKAQYYRITKDLG